MAGHGATSSAISSYKTFHPSKAWPTPHRRTGPWQISYPSFSKLALTLIRGRNTIGIKTTPDVNHGKPCMIGVTHVQMSIGKLGMRSSTATAYLTDEVCARESLKISVWMTVTRITHRTGPDREFVARGVELASGHHVPVRYRVKAKRDVILAAGAVHSLHLLLLSGIGSEEQLEQNDIELVKDLLGWDRMGWDGITIACGVYYFPPCNYINLFY